MTAIYIAPRVPLVDPRTGLVEPIWYRFFSSLFNTDGEGAVDEAALVAPSAGSVSDQFLTLLDQGGGDQSPAAQNYFFAADDVLPMFGMLRDEIAMLRAELNDIKQGGPVL